MIEILNLTKKYISKNKEIIALDNINLKLENNTFNLITGKSGSGKTTLLNLIATMETPTSGKILIDGINYFEKKDKVKALFKNQKVGFVFQNYNLEEKFTLYENIELPLLVAGINKKERKTRILQALSEVGLEDRASSFAHELSGGQKQRIAIARALINNPQIILADEPCASLDESNSNNIYDILLNLKKNRTVVVVSHQPSLIVNVDKTICLANGVIEND